MSYIRTECVSYYVNYDVHIDQEYISLSHLRLRLQRDT